MRVAFMASAVSVPNFYNASAEEIFNWHGGNTGNVAFVSAIHSHLKCTVTRVDWNAPAEQLKQVGDVVVIACANQLGPHTNLARTADNLDRAGLPIVAIGLGAQANSRNEDVVPTEGTKRWIEVINAHRPSKEANIGVRGAYTLEQLEKLGLGGGAAVIGCPSNLTNLSSDYIQSIEERSQRNISCVSVALGHPYTPSLTDIERQIVGLADDTNGTCIVQHDLNMIRLSMQEFEEIAPKILEQMRAYYKPAFSLDEFKEWCRRKLLVFADAPNWMAWLKRYDFVIGPRFHGVMLAIQAGIPAGCIAHDSRTLELCETMAIPVRMYDTFEAPLSLDNLHRIFAIDAEKYRTTRATLAKQYTSILSGASLPYDERLGQVASGTRADVSKNAVTTTAPLPLDRT